MEKTKKYNQDKLYDVIVIGGGPAGLTAALYLARAKYRVLVLEKEQFGGQITITHEVVNYPGIAKTSGKELTETMRRQADAFGAEFLLARAEGLDLAGDVKMVRTNKGDFYCLGILLATGAHPRTVGFTGEEEHKGQGVAYCATCDGEFFTDKEIFVVGGGFAAAEESVFLTKFAKHVTILIREEDFTCAAAVADSARNHEKITVITDTVVEEVAGEGGLDYIRYKNIKTDAVTEYRAKNGETFGVFVFVGYAPESELVENLVERDEQGYIITDAQQKTNVTGVYAAGDVCIKPLRQVVTATGDGALAATELEKYVAALQRKTGIAATAPVAKRQEAPESQAPLSHAPEGGQLFSSDMKSQLQAVFAKMQQNAILKLYLDDRAVSRELESFINAFASLSDKLSVQVLDRHASSDTAPCVKICLADGSETGLSFHGVPGGHEFTSFVLGIYNAVGPGQVIDDDLKRAIQSITKPTDIKVLVSLSCTMCPDAVVAAQHIAAQNPNITAGVYVLQHFDELRARHNVMSVPCIVINDRQISFGKKNIEQMLALINQ
ncbi:MAG: FAD-dependent oxidoreductase [Ruminococcaceae bacterium]|nr:FAD-dependent oxidoreductase [Oscillospiraceae bacterium]